MNNVISKLKSLRLNLFLARKTLGYSKEYAERVYKIYLNHSKVLHYRDGYPVYSLSTPALYSKPSANFFARSLFRTIQNKNLPNLMSFAINDQCNVNCQHCSFFSSVDDKTREPLTTAQITTTIAQAQELGVSIINFVGGEPLLHPDIYQIISSVDKALSTTVLFTNGLLLEKEAVLLKKSGLDSIYVSIDSADAATHDAFRRKKGLFKYALKGLQVAKKAGLSVGISCTITPESFLSGELNRIIELARSQRVHEVLIFDALPVGRLKDRADLKDNPTWVEALIESVKKYNIDQRYPGVLPFAYATSHRSVGC